MESKLKNTLLLSAESLYDLPMDVRIYIANMDIDTYIWLYLHDLEFREYATSIEAINDFVERFVVTRMDDHTLYKLGKIEYYKFDTGKQIWFMNDKPHRIGGPASIQNNGNVYYYVDGKLHNDNGPAVVFSNGYKAYYQHGVKHRVDGPAVIFDGKEEYWEYGVRVR